MKTILIALVCGFGAFASAADYVDETREAQSLRDSTVIRKSYHYCVEGTLTCRTMVLLNEKETGKPVDANYDVFLSSERAVGSTGYFLKNADGTFRAILDTSFDGKVNIDTKVAENQKLRVTFDRNGLPTYHNVTLKRLGTTRWIFAKMSYDLDESRIDGFEFDDADPTYKKKVDVIYKRIQE